MSDSHSTAHEPTQLEVDRPRSGLIGVMVLITIGLVAGICVGVNEYFKVILEAEQQKKVFSVVDARLLNLRVEEEQKLTRYQWVDSKHQQVRIPLERARELTLSDYREAAAQPAAPAAAPSAAPAGSAVQPLASGAPATPPAPSAAPPASAKEPKHP